MKASVFTLMVLFGLAANSAAQTARQRIGLHGNISYGAIGTPTRSAPDGARGDLILLGCEAQNGEEITVAAYLHYRPVREPLDPPSIEVVGEWNGVPVNQFGARGGYRSRNYGFAVANVRWRQEGNASRTVQLFMPYQVLELERRPYQVAYLIRVFVNRQLVDEFFTDETRYVINTGSRLQEVGYHCKALLGGGPSICSFRLLGTNDPPFADWGNAIDEVDAPTAAE
jgi:hypothetical protein